MKKQIKKTAVMAMAALALSTGGAITKGITAEAATYTRKVIVDVPASSQLPGLTGYNVYLGFNNGPMGYLTGRNCHVNQ